MAESFIERLEHQAVRLVFLGCLILVLQFFPDGEQSVLRRISHGLQLFAALAVHLRFCDFPSEVLAFFAAELEAGRQFVREHPELSTYIVRTIRAAHLHFLNENWLADHYGDGEYRFDRSDLTAALF